MSFQDPWHSNSQVTEHKHLTANEWAPIDWLFLSAYFSISSLRDRRQSQSEKANTWLLFICTRKQAGRQAGRRSTFVHKHKWKGERQSSFWHPGARCLRILLGLRFHSLLRSAAYACRWCVHLLQLVCSARPACVWMFLFRWHDWRVCSGESLFALYAARNDTLSWVMLFVIG